MAFISLSATCLTYLQPAVHSLPYRFDLFHRALGVANGTIGKLQTSAGLTAACDEEAAVVAAAFRDGEEDTLRMTGRLTVHSYALRLQSGGLLVYAPGDPAALGPRLAELGGRVTVIVVPSTGHDHFAASFQSAYPNATLVATPMVHQEYPTLRIDFMLAPDLLAPPSANVQLPLGLEKLLGGEVIFRFSPELFELFAYHVASQTLITCDLLLPPALPRSSSSVEGWGEDLWHGKPHPYGAVFSKAWLTHSIASPNPAYRTWLVGPSRSIGPFKLQVETDTWWLNQFMLNAMEEPANWNRFPKTPAWMLEGFLYLVNQLPLRGGVAASHVKGIIQEQDARVAIQFASAYLYKYARLQKTAGIPIDVADAQAMDALLDDPYLAELP